MSILAVYGEDGAGDPALYTDHARIAGRLGELGVRFERWHTDAELSPDADEASIRDAYADAIERLNEAYGFQSIDVVSLHPDHPQREEFRGKFLAEHIHRDFEVRFFVDGSGLFYLHVGPQVYCVLCEKGDLISVPENTTHWFDMGSRPSFKCIRFFVVPDGWVGEFTGSDIAGRFIDYDAFVIRYRQAAGSPVQA